MNEFFDIALGTVTMRPYVFAFFASYLVAAVLHLGWKKTVWFTVTGYLIAFASEYSSINNGFPYGWYHYVEATRGKELWVAGVPFFDSLSYVFLCYISYATALLVLSPVKGSRRDLTTLETGRLRRSFSALLLGSLFQVRWRCRGTAGFWGRSTGIGRSAPTSGFRFPTISAGGW